MKWLIEARSPIVLGPGRRSRHVFHSRLSGQTRTTDSETSSLFGPRENESGHAIGPPTTAWTPARERMRETIERAERYAKTLRREPGLTQGDLARREGVSGPRVNQILAILRLEPSILADLVDPTSDNPVPTLKELHAIGRLASERAQVGRYRQVCEALRKKRITADRVKPTPQRGFRHLFAKARTWQAMLDAGEARSVAALARQVKVSRHQVGRVLDLLTLPPEVQAALDVPAEQLPEGATQAKVKGLARLEGAAAQRAAWAEMVGAMKAGAK